MQVLTSIFEEQLEEKGSKLSDELDTPHFRDERLLDFLLADEVLDLVEPIIGPNIGLWSSHFICKDPHVGRATPWHEDSAYWNGRLSSFDKIITVWLAIDRSWKENGCMRVIPGTHHSGFSDYEEVDGTKNLFDTQIKSGSVDESRAVYFELEPGNARFTIRASFMARRRIQARTGAAGTPCGISRRTRWFIRIRIPVLRCGWPAERTSPERNSSTNNPEG